MKIKKGDNVMIMAGKDRGKSGKVEKVLAKENKLIIQGLNLFKVHQKPRKEGQRGQVVDRSMPINVSNVMMLDPKTQKPTRVGKRLVGDKLKRYAKKSGEIID